MVQGCVLIFSNLWGVNFDWSTREVPVETNPLMMFQDFRDSFQTSPCNWQNSVLDSLPCPFVVTLSSHM